MRHVILGGFLFAVTAIVLRRVQLQLSTSRVARTATFPMPYRRQKRK